MPLLNHRCYEHLVGSVLEMGGIVKGWEMGRGERKLLALLRLKKLESLLSVRLIQEGFKAFS